MRKNNFFDRITERLTALIGLDFDIDFKMQGDHFNQLDETLYLGARPDLEHVPALKEIGITHIVSCLESDEQNKMPFLAGQFQTLFLPIRDVIQEDIAATFPAFFDFANQARIDNAEAKVYVHCQVGVSRSATLAIAYLMTQERARFYETYQKVRSKRIQVLPNIGFASQLQQLENKYHPESSKERQLSSLAKYLHQICNVPVEIELLQTMLENHNYDAFLAIQAIFGDDIPRVIQGVRL
ncbi:MAG: dual specificity protein phosphatase [Chloroflexota bacterium]